MEDWVKVDYVMRCYKESIEEVVGELKYDSEIFFMKVVFIWMSSKNYYAWDIMYYKYMMVSIQMNL